VPSAGRLPREFGRAVPFDPTSPGKRRALFASSTNASQQNGWGHHCSRRELGSFDHYRGDPAGLIVCAFEALAIEATIRKDATLVFTKPRPRSEAFAQ
jgi:hypothetical protein